MRTRSALAALAVEALAAYLAWRAVEALWWKGAEHREPQP